MSNYTQTFSCKNNIIGVSGIIGVGKSTLCDAIAQKMGYEIQKEPVEDNEYLDKFYSDMARYSFPMQMYLLNHRFRQHQQMVWSSKNTVQDRTIYEDVIFAKMLMESDLMSELDFRVYVDTFQNMSNFLHRPDIIIFLDVKPEVAFERIHGRNRDCETGITLKYLQDLREGYEEWLTDISDRIPVIRVDWNEFGSTDNICSMIEDALAKKKGLVI